MDWVRSRAFVATSIVTTVLAAGAAVPPAGAQLAADFSALAGKVRLDNKVRVRNQEGLTIAGRLTSLDAASLTVTTSHGPVTMPAAQVREVAVKRSMAGWGAIAAFGIGFGFGAASATGFSGETNAGDFLAGGLMIGATFAPVGALIGWAIPHHRTVFRAAPATGKATLHVVPVVSRGVAGVAGRLAW